MPEVSPRRSLERALKQISAIVEAVSQASDAKARLFLRQLINSQSGEDSVEYLTKSLCNVAKQCADMYRTDFEYECLSAALAAKPDDAWTLVQLGDHFKRIGDFDNALATLSKAMTHGLPEIVHSSIADVWSEKGDFQRSLDIYKSIPNWESSVTIRTAIADNLRRMNRLAEAEREYAILLSDPNLMSQEVAHRVYAGQAQIAQVEGKISEAIEIYRKLMRHENIDAISLRHTK